MSGLAALARKCQSETKIAAGAQFAQTQFCMDGGVARRYVKRLVEEGITERLFMPS